MVKKIGVTFTIGLLLLITLGLAAGAPAHAAGVKLAINGQLYTPDVPPMLIGGRVMVPIRFVSQALGAAVDWDDATRTVVIRGEGYTGASDPAAVKAGEAPGIKIMVNGRLVATDVPPRSVDGRTLVPVRFVSEALGAAVDWDDAKATVLITSGDGRNTHRSEALRFSLKHAPGWVVLESGNAAVVQRSAVDPSLKIVSYGANAFVTPAMLANLAEKKPGHLFGAGAGSSIEPKNLAYNLTERVTTGLVGPHPAALSLKYDLVAGGKVAGLARAWILTAGGHTYLVSLVYFNPEDVAAGYAKVAPEIDAILASFTPLAGGSTAGVVFERPEWGLKADLGPGWAQQQIMEIPNLGVSVIFGNAADINVNLTAERVGEATTAEVYLGHLLQTLSLRYGEVKAAPAQAARLAGSDQGLMTSFRLNLRGSEYDAEQYVLVKGGLGYNVTLSMPAGLKDDPGLRAAIQALLDRLALGKPQP